jgi:hypothetical protein
MLSQNIFPLGKPSATSHFLGKITSQSAAGPSAQWMGDVLLQSRASSIAQGFENAAPAWPVQAKPCVPLPSALSVSIRAIRGSFSLPYERLDQLLINRNSWTPAQVFAHGFAIDIQRGG